MKTYFLTALLLISYNFTWAQDESDQNTTAVMQFKLPQTQDKSVYYSVKDPTTAKNPTAGEIMLSENKSFILNLNRGQYEIELRTSDEARRIQIQFHTDDCVYPKSIVIKTEQNSKLLQFENIFGAEEMTLTCE